MTTATTPAAPDPATAGAPASPVRVHAGRRPPAAEVLRLPAYRRWALADLASSAGTWMQALGLAVYVLGATGRTTDVGVTVLAASLGPLLLGPWGGALADRLPVRAAVVTTQAGHAVLALAGAALVAAHAGAPAVQCAAALGGVLSVVSGPALARACSALVEPRLLAGAVATASAVSSAGRVLGMALAAPVAALVGPAALFVLNAVSFAVVVEVVRRLPLRSLDPGDGRAAVRDGLRYGLAEVGRRPRLVVVLALALVLGALGRSYQVTMAAMAVGPLALGAGGYGVLSTLFAVGALLGGVAGTRLRRTGLPVLLVSAAAGSVLELWAGLAPSGPAFGLLVVPLAAFAVLLDTAVSTVVQTGTAEALRGRVVALLGTVSAGAGAVGAPLLGALCDSVGARACLVGAGAACLLAVTGGLVVLLRLGHGADRPWARRLTLVVPSPTPARRSSPA